MHLTGFEDLTEIGRGGFGVVLRAFQRSLQRDVAVKVLTTGLLDGTARQQFEREAQALGALGDHPNIIAIHDIGFTAEGAPYLVMPFLRGGSVADRVRQQGPLDIAETLRVGVRLCGALEIAHRRGVIHGDVKPDNILFDEYEEPQLCDFGIAELQVTGTDGLDRAAPLTPAFAPPEVLEGDRPTPASDVYSLAVTLSTMLRGRVPEGAMRRRPGTTPNEDLAALGFPPALCEALDDAMRAAPAQRPASAQSFGRLLVEVQHQLGQPETRMRVTEVVASDGAASAGAVEAPRWPGPDRTANAQASPAAVEAPRWPGPDPASNDEAPHTAVHAPQWPGRGRAPSTNAAADDDVHDDLLGGPTMVRGGALWRADPVGDESPEPPRTRSGRTTLAVRIGFAVAILASVVLLVLGRTGEDPLMGTSPIFGRVADPAGLARELGDPATFDGRARLMGAWWSLADFCVADGYGLAPCYDAAADAVTALVDVDPRTVALGADLDRASVTEGLEDGYGLTQVQLDRSPSGVPLDELTPGRPGIDLICPQTCTRIVADIEAARAAATADPLSDGAPPDPDGFPQPTGE